MYLSPGRDHKRITGWVGTVGVHLLLLWLVIGQHPAAKRPEPRQSTLVLFDVKTPKPPPPPVLEPEPPSKPKPSLLPTSTGGARQKPAPVAPVILIAAPARPTTTLAIATPPPLPASMIDDSGIANVVLGSAGEGSGKGVGDGNGEGNGHAPRYRNAEWIQKPTVADFRRVFPSKARQERIGGNVALSCKVDRRGRARRCKTLYEAPAGYGFGGAAIKLSPTFVIRPVTKDDIATDLPVVIRIAFDFAVR